MARDEVRVDRTDALVGALEHQILQRTLGRVHRLAVELRDGRVIIRGRTASHQMKQLVLQAVLEVLNVPDSAICMEIQVANQSRRPATSSRAGTPD